MVVPPSEPQRPADFALCLCCYSNGGKDRRLGKCLELTGEERRWQSNLAGTG